MNKLFEMDEMPVQETKSNEWYTPSKYIEAARAVMGSIDLDPASCELANMTVKAAKYYTKEQNGLAQDWHGRVWLNPPWGKDMSQVNERRSVIARWTDKLIAEYEQGNVEQATILIPSSVHTSWFHALIQSFPCCFTSERIHFIRPFDDKRQSNLFGNVLFYIGPNIASFVDTFTEFGAVITPDGVHRREQTVQQPTLFDLEAS
jgi:ParB family chromosome partitioning protein